MIYYLILWAYAKLIPSICLMCHFLFNAVIEKFELFKERNPGEVSISDLSDVLKLSKELCEAQVLLSDLLYCNHLIFYGSNNLLLALAVFE